LRERLLEYPAMRMDFAAPAEAVRNLVTRAVGGCGAARSSLTIGETMSERRRHFVRRNDRSDGS
jgi:hypothetical protein